MSDDIEKKDEIQSVETGVEKMFLGEDASEATVEEGAASGKEERLAKFLAAAGIASRRSCEELIEEGRVTVNDEAVTSPAYNVDPEKDVVRFEGRIVETHPQGKIYILLNKPVGYTCSAKDEHAEKLVFELIPQRFGRLFTVGRLDRDSEGMLILTNDGDYAQKIMHPSRQIYKRYYVECEGQFTTSLRRRMIEGFYDNDEFIRALNVEEKSVQKGHCSLIFTLGEGRKREVRRLCKDVGLEVRVLRRISIGALEMDEKLNVGSWRLMTSAEQEQVFAKVVIPDQPASEDPRPYWQKPRATEERKPFDRNNRPYMASPYPEKKPVAEEEGGFEGRGERRSFGDRKPFGDRDHRSFGDRDHRSFGDRDHRSFGDHDRKPFGRKPFGDRDRKPFGHDGESFHQEERRPWYQEEEGVSQEAPRSFDREDSFGGEERSFERKPFDRNRKPFGERRSFGDRDRKPFGRKPFDRDRKPFGDRDRKPFGDREEGEAFESGEERSFDRKPFDRDRKPFGRKPFGEHRSFGDRDRKPFGRKPFGDRDRKPFGDHEEGGEPFEGGEERSFERKPFDRDRKPFGRKPFGEHRSFGDRKPFDRDRKPFDRDRKPFGEHEEGGEAFEGGEARPFGERKSFARDRKPFGSHDRKPFDRDRKPFGKREGGFGGGHSHGGFGGAKRGGGDFGGGDEGGRKFRPGRAPRSWR